MDRREFIRTLTVTGAGYLATLNHSAIAQVETTYKVYGAGPTIILFRRSDEVTDGYIELLTDAYQVVVLDLFQDVEGLVDIFTPDYVCGEILKVADETGSDNFAYFGYSWTGTVGLQLTARTNRLSALICGGWPPLGAPYDVMPLETVANAKAYGTAGIYTTYYKELVDWPEREAVSRFTCPRLVFGGSEDVITTNYVTARIGPLIAEHREELESQGWAVRLVDGFRHDLGDRPDVVVPLVREFLDPLLL